MELYILSKQDLSILSICKVSSYEINLDEETNAKSTFVLMKAKGLKKGNFIVVNGLYRQFLFIIDEVQTEKDSNIATVTVLDISNLFDRKVIEKDINIMQNESIEKFIANSIAENFVNSSDAFLNIGYIDIVWHTNTKTTVSTNAENGLYNFHTFLVNCRQYKNIYTEFKFENGRLKIDIENKEESTELIDTTLPEVTDYNKIQEEDITAKVQVYIRENGSEYNLYLRTDRTTTTNKNDPNRAVGKIEVISVDTADKAAEEALNVMKGNNYNHLVEFKIAKTSKLMDVTKLYVGKPVRIKTKEDIYDSYISAITLKDENFVYFKTGNLRITLLDKLKKTSKTGGDKLDKSGGIIKGDLSVLGDLQLNGKKLENVIMDKKNYTGNCNDITETSVRWINGSTANCPPQLNGIDFGFLFTMAININYISQEFADANSSNRYVRSCINGNWTAWELLLKASALNNINMITNAKSSSGLAVTSTTNETTVLEFTIEQAGRYLFYSKIPLNYYGQSGRDLYLRLKVNNIEIDVAGGVLNTYIYTHYETLFATYDIPANSNIKVTIKNSVANKNFAVGAFALKYMRLK